MFRDLLAALDSLRLSTARFRRVALHLHSPDSYDWGRQGEPVRNKRSRFDGDAGADAFSMELAQHLDLACITDHMRCTFAARLSARSQYPIILPGMEVNVRLDPLEFARIHVLTILPGGSTTDSFACLFANQLQIPRDDSQRTGQEDVTGLSLKEWVDRVHQEGGLCIAAHVENKNGVRCVFRQAANEVLQLFCDDPTTAEREFDVPEILKEYLFDSGLDAVEIRDTKDGKHYRWTSRKDGSIRSIATILTFDAHNCESFGRADRITHIKMTSLAIGGLRNALRFPDTRIRFPQNLPPAPNPRLLGISIKGQDDSFFRDVTIALAENLNCIIGVRGSGKSTIIEALRYVFGYNRTLNELGDTMEEGIRELQRANLQGTIIRVAYRLRSGEDRVLQATFDDKSDYSTRCFSIDGEPHEVANVESCGEYPLRLFGWSEIETLGRSPTRQRDLLDRLIPELVPVLRRRTEVRNGLAANRAVITQQVVELQNVFSRNNNQITRFREFTTDFERLNTPEVRQSFAALDLARAKRRLLVQLQTNATSQIEHFESLAAITLQTEIEELLGEGNDELRQWWLGSELQALGVNATEAEVRALYEQVVQRLRSFRALVETHVGTIDREIESIESELQRNFDASGDDSMQRIADLRANAERRLTAVAEARRQYLALWNGLENALTERDQICQQLTSVQNEIAGIRAKHNAQVESTLNRFLPDWMTVAIQFLPGRDLQQFSERLADVIPGRANNPPTAKLRQAIANFLTPVTCGQMLLRSSYDEIIGRRFSASDREVEVTQADVDECKPRIVPFERDEHADVPILTENGKRLNTILEAQEIPWDDYSSILLDGDPVNEKSPGQRASAMLPLIALAEEAPLVIDQPEDNLDKRLVGSVLMQVLAELKEKRQITVCTHDPNILVGGDAEQVIVLKAESGRRGTVETHGSIDNEQIVKTVIDLLEGRAEAFEARRKRYGLDGENKNAM